LVSFQGTKGNTLFVKFELKIALVRSCMTQCTKMCLKHFYNSLLPGLQILGDISSHFLQTLHVSGHIALM